MPPNETPPLQPSQPREQRGVALVPIEARGRIGGTRPGLISLVASLYLLVLVIPVGAARATPEAEPSLAIGELLALTDRWRGVARAFRHAELSIDLRSDGAHLGAASLQISGLEARGRVRVGTGLDADLAFRVARIRGEGFRLPLDELRLEGSLDIEDQTVDLSGALSDHRQRARVEFSGRYEIAERTGDLDYRLAPLRFAPAGLRMKDLAKELGEVFPEAKGEVEARGLVRWHPRNGLSGSSELALRELNVRTEAADIVGINGVMRFSPPWPPQTPPGQVLSIRRVDLGAELTDGLVRFALRPDGVVDIESAIWSFAGGTISTRGPLDLRAERRPLRLELGALDLDDLLSRVRLDGLRGQGRVTGTLPLEISDKGVRVTDGALRAAPGGRIRYRPSGDVDRLAAGTPGFEVLLPALSNFTFDKLQLSLDGALDGELHLALELDGTNPEFQNGQPIELNLNVDARLADVLSAGEWIDKIPEHIERELDAFRRRTESPGDR